MRILIAQSLIKINKAKEHIKNIQKNIFVIKLFKKDEKQSEERIE